MYIYLIILAIILTFLLSHYLNYTKINATGGIDIQQTEQPAPAVIDKMLATKLPSIFMYEIELWDGFDLLIGYPYDVISTVFKDNKELVKILKSEYLAPFALPLTRDWQIGLNNLTATWATLTDKPIREKHYNHLIANFSGLLMVCLIHPNSGKQVETYKNSGEIPFTKHLETQSSDITTNTPITDNEITEPQYINYLTIPVRPGHVMYIPYGWYYYIYCGQENTGCVYMDLVNKTWFA
jgi:hypothetical protein